MPVNGISCDACAFRRVRCDGTRPCADCRRRCIECTRLRPRRKRGPKGPRASTNLRIEAYREELGNITSPSESGRTWSYENAPAAYHAHLRLFRERLYSVWPVVDSERLEARLAEQDWQPQALAAALCAAVIGQLRLDRNPEPGLISPAGAFASEAEKLRQANDYRESCSVDALLTSFFLHIYYANVRKLVTSAHLLRETVTTMHVLRLHEPATYTLLPALTYQWYLRIFWVVFVTERTFCAQNNLAPILSPISEFPSEESLAELAGFADLARLFVCLDASFVGSEPPARLTAGAQADKVRILSVQQQLAQPTAVGHSETQHVDINVTRHWIRTIIWQYTITNFAPITQSPAPAFAPTFPTEIARDGLQLLANASTAAIRAHGYGMELKISRLANALLDVFVYIPGLKEAQPNGWRDALESLSNILHTVGGGESQFSVRLRERMIEADLPMEIPRSLTPWLGEAWEVEPGLIDLDQVPFSSRRLEATIDLDAADSGDVRARAGAREVVICEAPSAKHLRYRRQAVTA